MFQRIKIAGIPLREHKGMTGFGSWMFQPTSICDVLVIMPGQWRRDNTPNSSLNPT
jgi:hypothetical protein